MSHPLEAPQMRPSFSECLSLKGNFAKSEGGTRIAVPTMLVLGSPEDRMHAVVLIKQLFVNVREWRPNMRKRLRGAAPVRDLRCAKLREEFRAECTSLRRRARRWCVLTRSADLVRRNRCIICLPFFREVWIRTRRFGSSDSNRTGRQRTKTAPRWLDLGAARIGLPHLSDRCAPGPGQTFRARRLSCKKQSQHL